METAAAAETVNATQAARRIGVGPSTIRAWIFLGRLPAERDGWTWKIKVSDLDAADTASMAGAGARQRGRRGKLVRYDDHTTATGGAPID